MHIVRFLGDGRTPRVGVGLLVEGQVVEIDIESISELLHLSARGLRERWLPRKVLCTTPRRSGCFLRSIGLMEVWRQASPTSRPQLERNAREPGVGERLRPRLQQRSVPSLFVKSTAWRVVGDGRADRPSVRTRDQRPRAGACPLSFNAQATPSATPSANDVSSRSIERGETLSICLRRRSIFASCAVGFWDQTGVGGTPTPGPSKSP